MAGEEVADVDEELLALLGGDVMDDVAEDDEVRAGPLQRGVSGDAGRGQDLDALADVVGERRRAWVRGRSLWRGLRG